MNPDRTEPPLRMLLVEDHADTRNAISDYLQRLCHVTEAGSVHAARQRLQSETFDVILSDAYLPDGTGCDILRGQDLSERLFAVSMSARSRSEVEPKFMAAGFRKHLQKPLRPETLDDVVAEAKDWRAAT